MTVQSRTLFRLDTAAVRASAVLLLTATLAACSGSGAGDHAPSTAPPVAAATAAQAPSTAPAAASTAQPASTTAPNFDGIGTLRFGMTAAQMHAAWGAPLYGQAQADDPQACYYLAPAEHDDALRFMVEGDRFVRVDVNTATAIAPGGGGVGMPVARIEQLYLGHVAVSPNKYDSKAKTLRVTPENAGGKVMVFETDASGHVTSWRIGVSPQIDYVEGCS